MNILVVLICIFVLIIAVKKYKKYDLEISEKRNEYLYSINDVESLKKIGAINFMGVREDWVPNATSLIPYLKKNLKKQAIKILSNI